MRSTNLLMIIMVAIAAMIGCINANVRVMGGSGVAIVEHVVGNVGTGGHIVKRVAPVVDILPRDEVVMTTTVTVCTCTPEGMTPTMPATTTEIPNTAVNSVPGTTSEYVGTTTPATVGSSEVPAPPTTQLTTPLSTTTPVVPATFNSSTVASSTSAAASSSSVVTSTSSTAGSSTSASGSASVTLPPVNDAQAALGNYSAVALAFALCGAIVALV